MISILGSISCRFTVRTMSLSNQGSESTYVAQVQIKKAAHCIAVLFPTSQELSSNRAPAHEPERFHLALPALAGISPSTLHKCALDQAFHVFRQPQLEEVIDTATLGLAHLGAVPIR
jgi:hypothetical protein